MPVSDEDELLREYRGCKLLYEDLARTLSDLLEKIIAEQGVQLHSVTHRAKEEQSLAKKLLRSEGAYQSLEKITDLAGVRVITYFHDQVDSIARMVEAEFEIDPENSIDKRKLLDPDRFGYLSVHYIAELGQARSALPEYKRFKSLKVEIQIRSMLQHVWAEVEHDLGYKSSQSVPATIRRRFARLAGLLEIADAEFAVNRDALSSYEAEVPTLIANEPASVLLDKASLFAFENSNDLVHELDQFIGSLVGGLNELLDASRIERHLACLNFFGITTIGDLDDALHKYQQDIKQFARIWLEGTQSTTLFRGICLLYLQYVILARQGDSAFAQKWASELKFLSRRGAKLDEAIFEAGAKAGILGPLE
jgi:ppGpp synthetase/RelA/SpoT-type nucleotidyltranferase